MDPPDEEEREEEKHRQKSIGAAMLARRCRSKKGESVGGVAAFLYTRGWVNE